MRQVPRYVVIGNGCMARHICHYLSGLKLECQQWYRQKHSIKNLHKKITLATHVLILISDKAIDEFIQKHLLPYKNLIKVSFSGCFISQYSYSAHPLFSFIKNKKYALETYQEIPFVIDNLGSEFSDLLSGLNFFALLIGGRFVT